MTDINSSIKTVRVGSEASLNATPSVWTYLEPQGDPLFPDVTTTKIDHTGQRDGGSVAVRGVGPVTGAASIKLDVRGNGTGAGDGVTAGDGEMGVLFDAALGVAGNADVGAAIVSATGSPTTAITVGSGDGAGFTVGNAVMFLTSAGKWDVRFVDSIVGDVITLDRASSGVAVTASAVLYASTAWTANQTDSDHGTLQLQVYDDDNWSKFLKGASVTCSIDAPSSGKITADFSFVADDVDEDNSSATAPTFVAATDANPIPVMGVPVYFGSDLTETIDLKIDFGFDVAQRVSQHGVNGFAGHIYTWRGAKVSGKIYFDATLYATMQSASTVDMLIQLGTAAGNAMGIRMAAVDFTAKHTTDNGLDVIEFEGVATGLNALRVALFAAA